MKTNEKSSIIPLKVKIFYLILDILFIGFILIIRIRIHENIRNKNFEELRAIAKLKAEEISNFLAIEKYNFQF